MDNYEWLEGYKPESKFGLFSIDRDVRISDGQPNYTRQKTKGAAALELIIKKTLSENIDGIISNSAIAEAENKFGTFRTDGSRSVPARHDFVPDSE